jgi:hypothetical protein
MYVIISSINKIYERMKDVLQTVRRDITVKKTA